MKHQIEKAEVLIEALPYIQQFRGTSIIIKYGGSAMVDEKLKQHIVLDTILMRYVGINVIVVHGGGHKITEYMHKMDKKAVFLDGMRVTDAETMNITEMILTGLVNKDIVARIHKHGGNAVGLSGKDGRLIEAKKLIHDTHDYGYVGEITKINAEILRTLDNSGFVPVISPIGIGTDGVTYNINADIAASEIAIATGAEKLIFLTDVPGICTTPNEPKSLINTINHDTINTLIADGSISGGMLPKVKAGLRALEHGIKKVHIIDGRISHSILLELFTESGIGTEIV